MILILFTIDCSSRSLPFSALFTTYVSLQMRWFLRCKPDNFVINLIHQRALNYSVICNCYIRCLYGVCRKIKTMIWLCFDWSLEWCCVYKIVVHDKKTINVDSDNLTPDWMESTSIKIEYWELSDIIFNNFLLEFPCTMNFLSILCWFQSKTIHRLEICLSRSESLK